MTQEKRAARYSQHLCLVVISGQKGIGRRRLARALESHLFHNDNFVFYLGMGSVVYGVDADIHGRSGSKVRREHIRRMAEIANILITTGIILIITAVEITAADLTLFQTILDPTRIVTIWVGTNTSMDSSYEINLVESASIEESVPPIVQKLQDGGFIVENS